MQNIFRRKSVTRILREAEEGLLDGHGAGMNKVLGVRDLTFMGIAAIVGAGIFSTIGKASFDGGPGIVLLFLFVSVACGFSALCYAEFASMVPVSGSAYTYSYVAFGEVIAWIIGWDLLMEYAIGNIAVAISWSDYFTTLLNGFGIHIPSYFTMDYWSAREGYTKINDLIFHATAIKTYHAGEITNYLTLVASTSNFGMLGPVAQKGVLALNEVATHAGNFGQALAIKNVDEGVRTQCSAFLSAPKVSGLRIICDLPAFLITVVITWIIYVGIKESKRSTNAMVILKMAIILLVLVAGAFYVQPSNWAPFLPNGISGVLTGTSAVFFSYIGFDAISTTAEECRNPQRDLPKAMFNSLIICTIVYVLIALVLTGMVSYKELNLGDPLAFVFKAMHNQYADYIAGVVAVSAVIATASVLLVFQLGQPRIWMSMSRDGLLPPIFSRIHPKYKTPSFSTILTGLLVGIPALFLNLQVVVDLTSVGTLFAFVLVCGGILRLQQQRKKAIHLKGADIIEGQNDLELIPESKFKTPYVNSKWIISFMFALAVFLFVKYYPGGADAFFNFKDDKGVVTWHIIREKVPYLLFGFVFAVTAIMSFIRSYSLIPVLGFLCCTYLLCESGTSNWERFLIWLVVGLIIYFLYGIRKSKLSGT